MRINLAWIPSHKDPIQGNEKADELGVRNGTRTSRFHMRTHLRSLNLFLLDSSGIYLDGEFLQKGLLYKQYFRDSSPKTWYAKLILKREEIILINRIRSNHYNLNASLFRKNMVNSEACPCGEPPPRYQPCNFLLPYHFS